LEKDTGKEKGSGFGVKILVDHDIEGHALMLWGALAAEGWLELLEAELVLFKHVGLSIKSNDREVWRFAQSNRMMLITNNRNMEDPDSLEATLREENTSHSLPVLTIGRVNRLDDKQYRSRCVNRLVDILLEIDKHRGTARVFIP
jgi:hypothetical protein